MPAELPDTWYLGQCGGRRSFRSTRKSIQYPQKITQVDFLGLFLTYYSLPSSLLSSECNNTEALHLYVLKKGSS